MEIALSLIGGLILLILGGEFLVRGAVQLAERMGVSPLLIGLTLVGFGTSTPELVTSVQAALAGSPGIAVGNIVGSNIANILLILGLSALITPVVVGSNALKRDGSLVVITALILVIIGYTMPLSRPVGIGLVLMLAAYIYYAWRTERVAAPSGEHCAAFEKAEAFEDAHPGVHAQGAANKASGVGGVLLSLLFAVGGLVLVVVGGSYLVDGAIQLARAFNISETVIGLTIVAIGTSMPEFVTSVIAAIRKNSDVALGNILGSNIYNVLGIGGVTAIISPTVVPPEIVAFDNLVMLGVSVLLFAVAWTGLKIDRKEGALLLAGYIAYVWWIWP